MLKKFILLSGILALAAGLAQTVSAQQLYVSHILVGDDAPNADGYCDGANGTLTPLPTPGNDRSFETSITGNPWNDSALIEFEKPRPGFYPGGCLTLCAKLVCVSTGGHFGVDELTFEIFKFGKGANPLDPSSTPPIKTVSLYNIGTCQSGGNAPYTIRNEDGRSYFCTSWDGSYNINGIFGKTNGQYGFRARVRTNQVSQTAGNISIEQTAAYPGENQYPIQVNVTNIHAVRSSPTVVGRITGVAAQPYNVLYRLSKDAIVNMNVYDAGTTGSLPLVRNILVDAPRVGEGTPDGTLTNGDFWDGRDNDGNLVQGGNYILRIDAESNDHWDDLDIAYSATVQLSLDPLQITDVGIKPLGPSSTDLAVLSYTLTEPATVYVDIYTPGTQFTTVNASPPTIVGGTGSLLRRFVEVKDSRVNVNTFWDGRDSNGRPVCDGNYMYAIYAMLPSGSAFAPGGVVKTLKTQVGVLPVARGKVVALLNPSSTVIGTTPTVAGLDPFYFRYTPSRDTLVSLTIKSMDGQTVIRNVVQNEQRFANFSNRDLWDGKDNSGYFVSSGSYLAELLTNDVFQCSAQQTSTVTAIVPVNMFRVVDLRTTPLMGGTSESATIAFEMSQPMYTKLNIYAPGTIIDPSAWPNPPAATPRYSVEGLRPGRFKITEYWDGRDTSGRLVEDGRYPFMLIAYSSDTSRRMYATDKTYGYADVSRGKIIFTKFDVIPTIPQMYNSSDTVKLPPYQIDYSVTRQSIVSVQVLDANGGAQHGQTVAHVVTESRGVRDGGVLYNDFWDGRYSTLDSGGNIVTGDFVPTGSYDVRITAKDIDIDPNLLSMATVQMTMDVDPLRIYDVAITPLTLETPAVISYQVSEPMRVVTKIFKPGYPVPPGDDEMSSQIIKRIIGVRPSRTAISEYWDGTDLTLSKVGDGNYGFKIYASTVTQAISMIDGMVGSGYSEADVLAPDVIVANIPVTRGGTADLCGDFSREAFFAPNPYTGENGWFRIPMIMTGWVSLKIYNLAGDLVYKKDFGSVSDPREAANNIDGAGQCSVTHTHEACWPRVNSSGSTVAPGVYFAVIRFQATEGTRDVCQVVKKILVP